MIQAKFVMLTDFHRISKGDTGKQRFTVARSGRILIVPSGTVTGILTFNLESMCARAHCRDHGGGRRAHPLKITLHALQTKIGSKFV